MIAGSSSGWSPCTLITRVWSKSEAAPPAAATSSATTLARRSLPELQSGEVISTGKPQPSAKERTWSLSVHTTTAATPWACRQRSSTCWSMGLPAISASSLPGSRADSSRAGTATTTRGTDI